MPPAALLTLPSDLLRQLRRSVLASETESVATQAIGVLLSPHGEVGGELVRSSSSPHLVVELAARDSSLLHADVLAAAETDLLNSLESVAAAARRGNRSFGGRTIPQSLAILAHARGTLEQGTVDFLVSLARDGHLPGDLRLDVLVSLASLSRLSLLSRDQLDALKSIDAHRGPSWLESVHDELLAAALLVVRAGVLTEDDEVSVLTLSRHSDARVRQMTCRAAGRFLSSRTSMTIESALLASLYDPEEAVLVAASDATAEARLTHITTPVINARLVELYGRSGRRVRAAAVRSARTRLSREDSQALREMLVVARRDPSWAVRDAAGPTPLSE